MAPRSLVASDHPAFWHPDAVRGPSTPSFDDLVGAGEELGWDFESERLRGFEVDYQLELSRLYDRHVDRPLTVENAAGVGAGLAILVGKARSVAHKSADLSKFALIVYCRYRISCRERCELYAIAEQLTRTHQERVETHLRNSCKGLLDLVILAGAENFDLHPNGRSCLLQFGDRGGSSDGNVWIYQYRKSPASWQQFA